MVTKMQGAVVFTDSWDLQNHFKSGCTHPMNDFSLIQESVGSCSLIEADGLEALEADLCQLASVSTYPNPFLSLPVLRPAIRTQIRDGRAEDGTLKFLCTYVDRQLTGFLPVVQVRNYMPIPFTYLKSWMHPYCFLGDPLIRPSYERSFLNTLREGMSSLPGRPRLLRLEKLSSQSPFVRTALAGDLAQDDAISNEFGRAALMADEANIDAQISGKKRRELARQLRRLNEYGAVRFQYLYGDYDPLPWALDFLELEHKGWKGRMGISFLENREDQVFFLDMIQGMARQKNLLFQKMTVSDITIAMSVNFLRDGQGHGFKSCYDEDYASSSPGVLATQDLLRYLRDRKDLIFFDTCAAAGSTMLEQMWPHRRCLTGVSIGSNGSNGHFTRFLVNIAELVSGLKKRL